VLLLLWYAFSALTLLVGHEEEHVAYKKIEWWGVSVVMYLEQGADCLHMVQLMPLLPKIPSSNASVITGLPVLSWRRGIKWVLLLCFTYWLICVHAAPCGLWGIIRASVKLLELGVRMPGVYFWAYCTPRVSIFGVFVRQAFRFSS